MMSAGAAGGPVELEDRAGRQVEDLTDGQPGAADLGGERHLDVVEHPHARALRGHLVGGGPGHLRAAQPQREPGERDALVLQREQLGVRADHVAVVSVRAVSSTPAPSVVRGGLEGRAQGLGEPSAAPAA